jgi:hypothetical protein
MIDFFSVINLLFEESASYAAPVQTYRLFA